MMPWNSAPSFYTRHPTPVAVGRPLPSVGLMGQKATVHGLPLSRDRPERCRNPALTRCAHCAHCALCVHHTRSYTSCPRCALTWPIAAHRYVWPAALALCPSGLAGFVSRSACRTTYNCKRLLWLAPAKCPARRRLPSSLPIGSTTHAHETWGRQFLRCSSRSTACATCCRSIPLAGIAAMCGAPQAACRRLLSQNGELDLNRLPSPRSTHSTWSSTALHCLASPRHRFVAARLLDNVFCTPGLRTLHTANCARPHHAVMHVATSRLMPSLLRHVPLANFYDTVDQGKRRPGPVA
jgi:hypothetical protein